MSRSVEKVHAVHQPLGLLYWNAPSPIVIKVVHASTERIMEFAGNGEADICLRSQQAHVRRPARASPAVPGASANGHTSPTCRQ